MDGIFEVFLLPHFFRLFLPCPGCLSGTKLEMAPATSRSQCTCTAFGREAAGLHRLGSLLAFPFRPQLSSDTTSLTCSCGMRYREGQQVSSLFWVCASLRNPLKCYFVPEFRNNITDYIIVLCVLHWEGGISYSSSLKLQTF